MKEEVNYDFSNFEDIIPKSAMLDLREFLEEIQAGEVHNGGIRLNVNEGKISDVVLTVHRKYR